MPQKHVTKNVGSIPYEIPTPNSSQTPVSACYQRRGISAHRLTTCRGPHQTQLDSVRGLFIVKSLCHPVVQLVGTGDVDLVVVVLVGQTSFVRTLLWCPPVYGDKLSCTARRRWSEATVRAECDVNDTRCLQTKHKCG